MGLKTFVSIAVTAALYSHVNAMLRFSCSSLVIDRLDPLVNPGAIGSPHLHQIVGGNSFAETMDPAKDPAEHSTCTTCQFTEDFSNYWTAVMYFKHPTNGSFKRVRQESGHRLEAANGGMVVYYSQNIFLGDRTENITAFRKGFRMLIGDPSYRKFESSGPPKRYLTFRCYVDKERTNSGPGDDPTDFPKEPCPGGIRTQVFFPSCWDGVNLDSPDHKSHVEFSDDAGNCPATHPVIIPQLFYETTWVTSDFSSFWKKGDPNPFVWSQGDPTGYGQHADYVFGWKGDSLQRAMNSCHDFIGPCNLLKNQTAQVANKCTIPRKVNDDIDSWVTRLPGDNPVTY